MTTPCVSLQGDQPEIQFYIQSTTDNSQSPTIPLTALSTFVSSGNFTSLLLDFSALPPVGAPLVRVNFVHSPLSGYLTVVLTS